MDISRRSANTAYSPLLKQCLHMLQAREAALHARGVLHAAVFGSVARGDEREGSDIDVIVEVQRGVGFGLTGLLDLQEELTRDFGRSVDVVSMGGLKSPKHDRILRDMIVAF
jgi:predicted nucleotidyltransferase